MPQLGPGIALPLEDVVATQRKPILWYGGSDARSELNATYTALAQYEFKFPLPTTPFLDSFTRRFFSGLIRGSCVRLRLRLDIIFGSSGPRYTFQSLPV